MNDYDHPTYDEDDPERYGLDGTCQECGVALDEDPEGGHEAWHSACWRCWRQARNEAA